MKNLLLFSFFALVQFGVQNDCDAYYLTSKGSVAEYKFYDAKGQVSASTRNEVKDISANGANVNVDMESTVTDKKGNLVGTSNFSVTCSAEEVKIDIRGFISPEISRQSIEAEMVVSGDGMSFPRNAQVGQKLKDSNNEMKFKMGIISMSTKIFIHDYIVEAKESVSTPAGTFETLRSSYVSDVKSVISASSKTVVWMAKGVGIVKQESYNVKTGKLESKMELASLKKG
jgi:hypothetical protein